MTENPLRSKRLLAYLATLAVLVVGMALKNEAAVHLGIAIEIGLPVFLGGESWVRGRVAKAAPPAQDQPQP